MDDEEEFRYYAPPTGSESPDPDYSPSSERVAVAKKCPSSCPLTSPASKDPDPSALSLLKFQNGGGVGDNRRDIRTVGGGGNGGGGDCYWSDGSTEVLIDAWSERYVEFTCGNLKSKHWQEFAEIVNRSREGYDKNPMTGLQCRNKIDTVKKKYKKEKASGRSNWVFFDKLDRLIGPHGGGGGGGEIPVGGSPEIPMSSPMVTRSMAKAATTPFRNLDGIDGLRADSLGRLGLMMRRCSEPNVKKKKKQESEGEGSNSKWSELSLAITRLGEAYLETENAKVREVVEMERERMMFLKEMESQRMKLFEKILLELSQLRQQRERRIENAINEHHNTNATVNNNNNNDEVDDDVGNSTN